MRGTTRATRNTAGFSRTKICKACWRSTGMLARGMSSFLCEGSRFRRRTRRSDKGDMWIVIRGSRRGVVVGCGSPGGGTPRNCSPGAYRGWFGGPIAADHAIGGMASTPLKKLRFHFFCKSRTDVADWPIRARQRVGDFRGDVLVKLPLPNVHCCLLLSHACLPLGFPSVGRFDSVSWGEGGIRRVVVSQIMFWEPIFLFAPNQIQSSLSIALISRASSHSHSFGHYEVRLRSQ